MTPFRLIRRVLGPRWLVADDGESELVGYALDIVKDGFIQRLYLGLLAHFPQTAPPDALAALGQDRRVIRGINESEESYALRLIAWLDDRKTGGNPYALMQKLSEYCGVGCSFRTVDVRGNWYSRAVDGTRSLKLRTGNWQWDHDTSGTRWSRFWVVIYPGTLWVDGSKFGDGGKFGEGRTFGTTATPEQVQTVRAIVADWKPAGTRCVNVVIALDPTSFDPTAAVGVPGVSDGLSEHWSKAVSGVQVASRLSTARYWDGV